VSEAGSNSGTSWRIRAPPEYQGHPFTFREDGYFNMTKAAKHFGKRLQHFWDNTDTASYVVALAVAISRDSGELKLKEEDRDLFSYFRSQHTLGVRVDVSTGDAKRILPLVLDVRRGSGVNGGGTWAHPKLAVFFARWLDVRFAVWCDLMVDEILRGRLEVQYANTPDVGDLNPTGWKDADLGRRHAATSLWQFIGIPMI
jgi:hypothetical protein